MNQYAVLCLAVMFFVAIGSLPVSLADEIPSPRQQLQDGIAPEDIRCSGDHVLVIRDNGNPSCVSFHTGYKLLERGWIANIPIHEQAKENLLKQQDPTSPLERAPKPNTIEFLKENEVRLDFQTLKSESVSNVLDNKKMHI